MRTAAKLGVFAAGLAVAFGLAAGIGSAAGPIDVGASDEHADEPHGGDPDPGQDLGGLAVADGGLRLVPEIASLDPAGGTYAFRIVDEAGAAVTGFDTLHERELHLVVLSRNLVDYHHVHPLRDPVGRWSADLPALASGSYRVFADFQPSGGERLTLGTDLAVAGTVGPPHVPHPAPTADVDGYQVSLSGAAVVGSSELRFAITRGGQAVVTDSYLGEAAHLVVIRTGDLGYLHVHPMAGEASIPFGAEFPTPGTYRLFLEFSHGGDVHLAPFTLEVGHDDAH